MQPPHFDNHVDARGLACPLPILKARQALATMTAGEILQILATDPVSAADFPSFAKATGHSLLFVEQQQDVWIYYLEKNEQKQKHRFSFR